MSNILKQYTTPQLNKIHTGKVRESFRLDENYRLIVTTDRLSCFDCVLASQIPQKGSILSGLAAFWFQKTRSIIENHFVELIDPNAMVVREAKPIPIEMIVRGYLTGSLWRKYQAGERTHCGVSLPQGMHYNDPFLKPIVTPTTKEAVDKPIAPKEIIASGLVSQEMYDKMEAISKELFELGRAYSLSKGLILVDTKYEFGLINGQLCLIDEVHTPDSSRFWLKEQSDQASQSTDPYDKEFVRSWLLKNNVNLQKDTTIPEDIIKETRKRYCDIYFRLTGDAASSPEFAESRLYHNLVTKKIIKDGYVAIICASQADMPHAMKLREFLLPYDVFVDMRMVSAHKNGEYIINMAKDYNGSAEPGAVIAIAGRSNGLGGVLSANLDIPVINCPPFKDKDDIAININSSLMMPSKAPAATCIDPENAAQCALRALNLSRLKIAFQAEINYTKNQLMHEDERLKEEFRYSEHTQHSTPIIVK